MTRIPRFICGLGFGMGLAVAGACHDAPSGSTADESETGDCVSGTENCYCANDSECGPGLVCASHLCTPDAGGSSSTTGSSNPATTEGTTSEPGTSTGSTGDSTGPGETDDPECDPDDGVVNSACTGNPVKPYCNPEGACVGCGGLSSCNDVSDITPVCVEDSGVCVQCTDEDDAACGGKTPVCNGLNACVACVDHDECDSGACNLATGACFENILHVDAAADCLSATGTTESPYCEIQEAVSQAQAGNPLVVRVKGSQSAYTKQIQIASNRTVAIVRDGNGTVNLMVPNLDSVLVNDGAMAFLDSIRISGGTINKGVACTSDASVWLDRMLIEKREGHAIDGVDCTLSVRRTKIYDNNAGGMKLNGGSARIENSYIVQNGNSFGAIGGILLSNTADLEVVYTTVVDNDAMGGVGESLHCMNPGLVSLRNVILFGMSATTSVLCPAATATNSVVDATSLKAGAGVVQEPESNPAWFVAPANGNFAVKADTPFKDVAVWRVGDPSIDYDGDARVTDDGVLDYTGADRPN